MFETAIPTAYRRHATTKGRRFPPDPPRVDEIIAVMREAGESIYGLRLRAVIVILWRSGLRIGEALALAESDLDPARGSVLVRSGNGGKRREVGMDEWAWEQLRPWLEMRTRFPVGPLLCVINAGVRRRFAPHQLRHAHAVEMAREGVPLNVIQRQLGHANLGVTSIYLEGIDSGEIIKTVHNRSAPMVSAAAALAR
jgi:site-specific recombinase XerD